MASAHAQLPEPLTSSGSTSPWQSVGPAAVETSDFGLVTGRISALALDPSDATGNRLYVGTTGGGVWLAQNAGTSGASTIMFTPLTDFVPSLRSQLNASITIGALTVQPGGTGVILAGTGDPNGMIDSYYGAGILRSTDSGKSWTLVRGTNDVAVGGVHDIIFAGEAFAGFAWSTANPQLVVAAISQAFEALLVNALQPNGSYQGLYYSNDAGATWHMADITDGGSSKVQGPLAAQVMPDGNGATSVVWNPVRKLFIAAVRYHGYYKSSDGVTWTRLTAQPGVNLTTKLCPTNPGMIGSIACPIYRGTLAVNPSTGDTFAWTTDVNEQDQGLWQDVCNLSGNTCGNANISFSKQWSTASLDTNTSLGAATLPVGSYTLALAAVPAGPGAGQDTLLFAGAGDIWKCSLAAGCVWRNTTNAATCKSAHVGQYQHAIEWNNANPSEIFFGNDSGLWRSMDSVGETGQVCSTSDNQHFQNLNTNLGPIIEPGGLSADPLNSAHILAGLGVNGATGVKGSPIPTNWKQIESGYVGPVAIDPSDPDRWYVNASLGVAIYRCTTAADCTPSAFGTSPAVDDADVGNDGLTMLLPASFIIDPLDSSQLLIGTCRLWRGSTDGTAWTSRNAVSPILDSPSSTGPCSGNSLIRSIAALALPNGTERVYVGMYGAFSIGGNAAGHVLTAIVDPSSSTKPSWQDLTLNPITNENRTLNRYNMDLSSVVVDPHDASGNTVYLSIGAEETTTRNFRNLYRSTDGGAHWANIESNMFNTPVNDIMVDPQDANTVYLATDKGVFFTQQVTDCPVQTSSCWSMFGSDLPLSPVTAIAASQADAATPVLLAATYGRGIWQAATTQATSNLTSATADPASISFADQAVGTQSSSHSVTLQNTGSVALTVTSIQTSGDFIESDNCTNAAVAAGSSCSIQVKFAPNSTGTLTGQLVVNANIAGGQLTVSLSGTGLPPGVVYLSPSSLDFAQVPVGSRSAVRPAQATNSGSTDIPINSVSISGPFVIATNSCGTTSLAPQSTCQIQIAFAPTQKGVASGTLTMVDADGPMTIDLTGVGQSVATDTLSATSLSFPSTASGTNSDPQSITLTNSGDLPLKSISIVANGPFQASNTCNAELAGGAACSIRVLFAPTQSGDFSGSLTITDAIQTQTVSLSGTGIAPATLNVTPGSLTFPSQQAGVASPPQTITISNSGAVPMANVGFQFIGAAAASYAISATNCGATLSAGASCTAQVVFTPPATGSIAAKLVVSSSTVGVSPVPVYLNGSGQIATGVTPSPTQLNFATVPVGQTSAAKTVSISNGSGFLVNDLAFSVNGPFIISQNDCTGAFAAGASCSVAIAFKPTSSGAVTGSLSISSPDMSAPAGVTLSGIGFDFSASVTGTASQSVASGQIANYTLAINPASGSSGTFTFTCSGLPANSTCTFNPSTMTLSSGMTGTLNVAIATGKSASASAAPFFFGRALPMVCGVFLLPLALKRNRKSLLQFAVLICVALAITSCGGSGGGSTGPSGGSGSGSRTPPGSYSIPITITSTGLSRQVTLTLTVD